MQYVVPVISSQNPWLQFFSHFITVMESHTMVEYHRRSATKKGFRFFSSTGLIMARPLEPSLIRSRLSELERLALSSHIISVVICIHYLNKQLCGKMSQNFQASFAKLVSCCNYLRFGYFLTELGFRAWFLGWGLDGSGIS